MNKFTLAALVGYASAEEFIGNDKCANADATRMNYNDLQRKLAQGAW